MKAEDTELLNEILQLKTKKNEMYSQCGPASSDYLDLSIKLNLLMNQYIDEKINHLENH